jgi:hypothetical protein
MIKAVETANAHYGTLLSLSLSPLDWRDLSINTAKKASAFLTKVRECVRDNPAPANDLVTWRAVWTVHRVPGFGSAEEFWGSELGQALRAPHVLAWLADASGDALINSDEETVLDTVSFERMVKVAETAGIIRSCDGRMLVALYLQEATMDEIAAGPRARELLGSAVAPSRRALLEHLRKVVGRIRAHADVLMQDRHAQRAPSIPMIGQEDVGE